MLADDDAVHVAHVHPGALGDEVAKAAGVQHRSGPEDPARFDVDGACRREGDDVDGVGDEDEDRVGRVLQQSGHHRLDHADVGGGQFQTGLPGLLRGPGGDDDDRRVRGDIHGVRAGHHAVRHELETDLRDSASARAGDT